MSSYFVVDHVSDQNKTNGLVESYQLVPMQYELEDGTVTTVMKRVNFVHWPELPNPFVHEEYSEDLVFSNIYTPEYDEGDEDDEDEDEEEEDEDEADFDGDYDDEEGEELEA